MDENEIILKLRELLIPVFGLSSIDEVREDHALVKDLGAESIDFVEILYIIEKNFGVVLKVNEIIIGGEQLADSAIFVNDKLTEQGLELLTEKFNALPGTLKTGMTKIEMFSIVTVGDLAKIIRMKIGEQDVKR